MKEATSRGALAVPLHIKIIFSRGCNIYIRLSRWLRRMCTRPYLSRVHGEDRWNEGAVVLGILDSRRGVSRRDAARRGAA